jgi:hypothetical protein
MEKRVEVILDPQEGRYYYTTRWTEKVFNSDGVEQYFSTNQLHYVGKYIGGRIEGWGPNLKEWIHFIDDKGEEVVVTSNNINTCFYEVKPVP